MKFYVYNRDSSKTNICYRVQNLVFAFILDPSSRLFCPRYRPAFARPLRRFPVYDGSGSLMIGENECICNHYVLSSSGGEYDRFGNIIRSQWLAPPLDMLGIEAQAGFKR